jgi:hypothetical protein
VAEVGNQAAQACHPDCALCRVLVDAMPEAIGRGEPRDLTSAALAATTGLDANLVRGHVGGKTGDLILRGYARAGADLFWRYRAGFVFAETWIGGLDTAAAALMARLVARPAIGELCYAAGLNGSPALLEERERQQGHIVALLTIEHERRAAPAEPLKPLQVELIAGGIFHAVRKIAVQQRLDQPVASLIEEVRDATRVFMPVAV